MKRFGRTKLLVAMRCDASPSIGSGHIMRSLTLADELSRQGSTVVFVCKRQEGYSYSPILERGYRLVEIENDDQWVAQECLLPSWKMGTFPKVLVIDHYGIDQGLESKFRPFFNKIAVIDDLNNRVHDCDLLIDPNVHSIDFLEAKQDRILGNPKQLIGPEYALLRPEFREYRLRTETEPTIQDAPVVSPLVFFGGTDPGGNTLRFLEAYEEALQSVTLPGPITPHLLLSSTLAQRTEILERALRLGVVVLDNPKNVAEAMSRCDFYIGSGGTITYERMALGLTGWVVSVAVNQEEISQALAAKGAHEYLGSSERIDFLSLCQKLLRGITLSYPMQEVCLNLIDGKGAERVAQELLLLATERILFISPYAGILPHSISDFRVAHVLKKQGCEIDYLSCGGVLNDFCVTMSAVGLDRNSDPLKKKSICEKCQQCSDALSKPFNRCWLVSSQDPIVQKEYERFTREFSSANFHQFNYKQIQVGKYASYESLLKYKKKSLQFTEDEFKDVSLNIRQCIQMIETLVRMNSDKVRWQSAVIYNTYYGVNAVAREFLKSRGVRVFSIHAGPNLSYFYDSLLVAREHNLNYYLDLKANWTSTKGSSVTPRERKMLDKHFDELFKGKSAFVYSRPIGSKTIDVRGFYKIPNKSKIILAAMSSYDERFAAQFVGAIDPPTDAVFPDQASWIKSLLTFASNNPDVFVLIRVHPREFPNKREGYTSEHAKELSEIFKQMPLNAAVNWPEDNISLYELLLQSAVLVSAWSSVAKEATLIGLPVLSYMSKALLFPSSLIHVGQDELDYHEKLRKLCNEGWSLDRAVGMMRWLVTEQLREVVFVGQHLFQNRGLILRLFEKTIRIVSYSAYVKWLTKKPGNLNQEKIKQVFSAFDNLNRKCAKPSREIQDLKSDYETLVSLRAKLIERIITNSESDALNSWRDPIATL